MIRTLFTLGAILLLSACATVQPMDQSATDDLRANDVAVALIYPEQKIHYDELVYKVLWNETRSATSSFKGIWDIDRDLSSQYAEQFRTKSLRATSVAEILEAPDFEHFRQSMAAYHPANQSEPFTVDERTRKALLDKGYEYLIAMRCVDLHVQAFSFGADPLAQLIYRMNVVDLRNNDLKYSAAAWLAAKTPVDKSPREIEANGLAILRASLSKALQTSFEKDIVPKQMGLVASTAQ